MGISDLIASFLQECLDASGDGVLEVQRNDLAQKFNCVPSQINYVMSTRFSPERGYIVESRRGGNGFIRITRVQVDRQTLLMHVINSLGSQIDLPSARAILSNLNQAGALDPGPAADGRVLCDGAQPGRGCFLRAVPGEKGSVGLRQTLPCTPKDLEVFYGLVKHICQVWSVVRFTQDGTEYRLSDIPQLKEGLLKSCAGLLTTMAERWEADGEGVLTGAVLPLYLEPEAIARLKGGDLAFFQSYLSQKQAGERYYAKPSFYRHDNGGDILGLYAVTEGVESIFPVQPFVPPLYSVYLQDFHVTDEQVTQWQVSLNQVWEENGQLAGKTLGYVSFEDSARRIGLGRCRRFDAKHVVVQADDLSKVLEN